MLQHMPRSDRPTPDTVCGRGEGFTMLLLLVSSIVGRQGIRGPLRVHRPVVGFRFSALSPHPSTHTPLLHRPYEWGEGKGQGGRGVLWHTPAPPFSSPPFSSSYVLTTLVCRCGGGNHAPLVPPPLRRRPRPRLSAGGSSPSLTPRAPRRPRAHRVPNQRRWPLHASTGRRQEAHRVQSGPGPASGQSATL